MTAAVQYLPSAYKALAPSSGLRRIEESVSAPFAHQQSGQKQGADEHIIDAEWQPIHEPIFYPGPTLEATPTKLFFSAEVQPVTLSPATVAARYQQMEPSLNTQKNRISGQKLDIFI